MQDEQLLRAPRISHRTLNISIESIRLNNFIFESSDEDENIYDSDDEENFSYTTIIQRPSVNFRKDLFSDSWVNKIEASQNCKNPERQSFLIYDALMDMNKNYPHKNTR